MRRNNSLFSRKNFNLIKNFKGNRQMQYAKQQIFLSQIHHLNIFARVNKKKRALSAALCKFQYIIINHLHKKRNYTFTKKKKSTRVYEHSTKSISLADCIQKLQEKNMKLEILIVKAIVKLEQHEFLVPQNFMFLWLTCFTR